MFLVAISWEIMEPFKIISISIQGSKSKAKHRNRNTKLTSKCNLTSENINQKLIDFTETENQTQIQRTNGKNNLRKVKVTIIKDLNSLCSVYVLN